VTGAGRTPGDLVVDTGPLCHLAGAGWLSVLRSVAGDRTVIIPEAVEEELREGLYGNSHLQQVLDPSWIEVRPLSSDAELQSFSGFAARLVAGGRNIGEAAVLAYAETHRATAVIDDGAGRRAALDAGVALQPTLSLLCQAIREGLLTVAMVSNVADHLMETEYRLPFRPGGFAAWAEENGLVSIPKFQSSN